MDPSTKKFIQQLRSITLSKEERTASRSALISAIREGGAHQAIPASWWARFLHARRVQATLLSLVIVFGYGSAVTLAAENALPGDTLYPIKRLVAEPIARLVTANTPAAQIKFETRLLNERLNEAEALDKRMKLAPDAPLHQVVREEIRRQNIKVEEAVRDAVDKESRARASRAATQATEASTSPAESTAKEGARKGPSGEVKIEQEAEHALESVLEEHRHILEKLNLTDRNGNGGGNGDENGKENGEKRGEDTGE